MNKLLIVYRKYWNGLTVLSALASFFEVSSTPAEFLLSFCFALKALFARAAILFSNQLPSTSAALSFHCLIFVVKYRVMLFFFLFWGWERGEGATLMYSPQFSPNLGSEKWQDQCYPPQSNTASTLLQSHARPSSLYAGGAAKCLASILCEAQFP